MRRICPGLLLFFSFDGGGHGIWKFLGQGLNVSSSCSSAGSFNPLKQAKDGTCASTETRAAAVEFLTHCTTTGMPVLGFLSRIP